MSIDTFRAGDIRAIFKLLAERMTANRDRLIELDGALGDGDLGITMSKGFAKASEALSPENAEPLGKLLTKAGMTIAASAPSTLGTLLAGGFMRAGKAMSGVEEARPSDVANLLDALVEGIADRGKAKPGDKTILDALYPAAAELRAAANRGASLGDSLRAAAAGAAEGFEKTKGMIGAHGRAAYYQERSLGKPDPGSAVAVILIEALSDYANQAGSL